jgi:hypothetical protein
MISPEGKEIILAMIGPGEFFGEMSLLDDEPRSATVIAMEPLELVTIWRADFLTILADNFSITNNPGATTYPIASFSWLILKKAQADATKGRALVYLFDWLTTDGQTYGKDLQYAPLPKPVQTYAGTQLKTVTASGAPILK